MRMPQKESITAGRVFLMLCSFFISSFLLAIAGMLSAAFAFAKATTIGIPFVATFIGLVEVGGSNAVTIDVNWVGTLVLMLVVTAPMCFFALRYRRSSGSLFADNAAD